MASYTRRRHWNLIVSTTMMCSQVHSSESGWVDLQYHAHGMVIKRECNRARPVVWRHFFQNLLNGSWLTDYLCFNDMPSNRPENMIKDEGGNIVLVDFLTTPSRPVCSSTSSIQCIAISTAQVPPSALIASSTAIMSADNAPFCRFGLHKGQLASKAAYFEMLVIPYVWNIAKNN